MARVYGHGPVSVLMMEFYLVRGLQAWQVEVHVAAAKDEEAKRPPLPAQAEVTIVFRHAPETGLLMRAYSAEEWQPLRVDCPAAANGGAAVCMRKPFSSSLYELVLQRRPFSSFSQGLVSQR